VPADLDVRGREACEGADRDDDHEPEELERLEALRERDQLGDATARRDEFHHALIGIGVDELKLRLGRDRRQRQLLVAPVDAVLDREERSDESEEREGEPSGFVAVFPSASRRSAVGPSGGAEPAGASEAASGLEARTAVVPSAARAPVAGQADTASPGESTARPRTRGHPRSA
jgi:hypothetical protein